MSEAREYLKVLDLIARYLRNENGNTYLRRGPGYGRGKAKDDLPQSFSSLKHLEDFLKFFQAYVRRTTTVIDLCLRIGGIEKSPFGSASDSTHFKYFRLRYKKTL